MGLRKIIWNRRAVNNFTSVFVWYREKCGESFAQRFFEGIIDTVVLLSRMPSIGMIDNQYTHSKTIYYSFLSHPKYRIVYRFTDTVIYIVDIRATQRKAI